MVDKRFRDQGHRPAPQLHPPAKVDFLHVRKKALVQAAQGLPDAGAHHQACPAHPKDGGRGVVLPVVFLQLLHYAPPAEWITVAVHQAARRTGILEGIPLRIGQQFGPAGSALRMAVHPRHQGPQPALRHFNVRIDEHEILRVDLLQHPVVASGEPVVAVQLNQRHLRELRLHHCRGTVRRGVVGHHHLGVQPFAGGDEPRKELPQVVLGVVIEYDDGRFRHLHLHF